VQKLYCTFDSNGEFWLDNVDAGGIVVRDRDQGYFLSAVLNSDVSTWAFLRLSKPFQNGYYSANKQFIAPLPIPNVADHLRNEIVALAHGLQSKHTVYRDQTVLLEKRLAICQWKQHKDFTLWPAIPTLATIKVRAPRSLSARDATAWAKAEHKRLVEESKSALLARLGAVKNLNIGMAQLAEGELSLVGDGLPFLSALFFDPSTTLRHFWWMKAARDWRGAKSLMRELLKEPVTDNIALYEQVEMLSIQLETLYAEIKGDEERMNEIIATAFCLTREEREAIANDPRLSWR
jgi:hypothetical protein